MANNNTLCGVVGRQKFNLTKDGVKLAEKLKNPKVMKYILSDFKEEKDKKKKKGPLNITYLLGQGLSTDCPEEACDLLFKREFGDDSVFNFGCKCFPEGYVPSSAKITDTELIDAFDDETKAFYKGDIVKFRGDFFGERKCYEGLRDFFQKSKDNLVIVQGAELINFKEPTRHREADFVIVNLTRKYIMNIECKSYLGPWEGKQEVTLNIGNSISEMFDIFIGSCHKSKGAA